MANANRVVLRDSYEIAIDEPLPNFDNPPALAYRVRDISNASRDLIGLICDPKLPTRFDLIAPMSRMEELYIIGFQDWGIVDWPPEGRRCPILIYERPEGGRLMTSLDATFEPIREEVIIEQFVEPMYQVLSAFRDQEIAHRAIRPTNVYAGGGSGGAVHSWRLHFGPPRVGPAGCIRNDRVLHVYVRRARRGIRGG